MNGASRDTRGQGLVEYALLLVLVAIVVIVSLTLVGPSVRDIFAGVVNGLGGSVGDPLVSLTAARTGNEGNDVTATITVSTTATVTVSDSQSGKTASLTCSTTCQKTITAVGFAAGTITVTSNGYSRTADYPPKG